ncbi:MAG: DNA glycosylase AlkZ-like family protein [Acidimicrobiales bacterium]
MDPLVGFSAPARAWFTTTFAEPTAAQAGAWPAIAAGDHTLVLAPTGSGKTLAAFFWALDAIMTSEPPAEPSARTRVLYISPLRALAVDVEKNLQSPLRGVQLAAERLGQTIQPVSVAIRSGDTPADQRRKLVRNPPDVLITTPESLYLMLTSRARETLRSVTHVIIDEIHAMAATKRGAHLSLTLERLAEICEVEPQRIGLSATQRPLAEIARFLGGHTATGPRPVTIVDAGAAPDLDLEVVVPVADMGAMGEVIDEPTSGPLGAGPVRRSIWPAMHPRLLELIRSHRSTLVFVNSRRLAERLAIRLNELEATDRERERLEALAPDERAEELARTHGLPPPPVDLVRAHHGSLSRQKRLEIEDRLKQGDLAALVCTSSLELGIDMGAVDLVVQVESPRSVASGLQRVGRAGHQVGETSKGKLFPKHRSDLIEATVVARQMRRGAIEETHIPRNPLDVLAQQIVAMTAMEDWSVPALRTLVRRSANFAELSDEVFANVLDLLSGRYPSEAFAELRPRVVWDRIEDTVRARAGAQRLAVTSGGTIPDRGLFGVFLPDGTRVGELDEEMVYESRPGETFLLGASTWRIEDITFERVIVTPAPGEPGKMPFWHGDGPGRPFELGQAVGEFLRNARGKDLHERLVGDYCLDEMAADNVIGYLDEQIEATGVLPDDRTIVVERFPDEIGDWRICILSPFGAQVHAPWAIALRSTLDELLGRDVELMWSDDGIVIRLPEAIDDIPLDALLPDPAAIEDLVIAQLPSTAMFSARFRECAARSLLLPRRRPDQRTPLWQQRQRAADLLAVASDHPEFPVLLETTRECLNDVFDLPGLKALLADVARRVVRVVPVDTPRASPFAQSLVFGWIAVYMYEGDAPLAERRATALSLDRDLLRDLLGAEELRELIGADVLADLELELQRIADGRRARTADEVHDLLRVLGPLDRDSLAVRVTDDDQLDAWLSVLAAERRAIEVTIAGTRRWAAVEDAARLRDALGVALPPGLPAAFTEPVERPVHDLVARYARTHGPFTEREVAGWLGLGVDRVHAVLVDLQTEALVTAGEFRPGGSEREWCDEDVLRRLRRRSLAALRHEVEPVDPDAYARFLPLWQGVGRNRRGTDAVAEALTVLEGTPLVASSLETDVLASRVEDYRPSMLDELCTSGEVVWTGAGALGTRDGRVRLVFRDHLALVAPTAEEAPDGPDHRAILDHLGSGGASFWPELHQAVTSAVGHIDEAAALAALWDLVWAGLVTNDSLGALRSRLAGTGASQRRRSGRPRPGQLRRVGPPSAAGRWSLVSSLTGPEVDPTIAAHARAMQLLERYGVVPREAVLAEGLPGGFAGIYPVFKALEEQGKVRRGYFVAGLGAAQFALAGAVDRLRDQRESGLDTVTLLAATDPAQPYGASLNWPSSPGRPSRSAGAHLVLVGGIPAVFVERGGRSIVTFDDVVTDRWVDAVVESVHSGRLGPLEIARIDGAAAPEAPAAEAMLAAGFVRGYKGLVLRPAGSAATPALR